MADGYREREVHGWTRMNKGRKDGRKGKREECRKNGMNEERHEGKKGWNKQRKEERRGKRIKGIKGTKARWKEGGMEGREERNE